jgi:hypothetical protein
MTDIEVRTLNQARYGIGEGPPGEHNRLEEAQIQALVMVYHETKSIQKAADAVGISYKQANRHILARMAESFDTYGASGPDIELDELRKASERELLSRILRARIRLIIAISSSKKIRDARMGELAQAFSILTDKAQLLMGEPTSRPEIISTQKIEEKLTPQDKAMLERLRRKLVDDGSDAAATDAAVLDPVGADGSLD